MARQENVIAPMTTEDSAHFSLNEQKRYARLVNKANITIERRPSPAHVTIGHQAMLHDCTIGDGCRLTFFSQLEFSHG